MNEVDERVAQIRAHRACCGVEHDPANGKLHGYCVVCGVPWPCEYAVESPKQKSVVYQCPRCATTMQVDQGAKPIDHVPSATELHAKIHDDLVRDAMKWRCKSDKLISALWDARDILYVLSRDSNDGVLQLRVNQYNEILDEIDNELDGLLKKRKNEK